MVQEVKKSFSNQKVASSIPCWGVCVCVCVGGAITVVQCFMCDETWGYLTKSTGRQAAMLFL